MDSPVCQNTHLALLHSLPANPFSASLVEHSTPRPSRRDPSPSRIRRTSALRIRLLQAWIQHSTARLRPLPHPHPQYRRLLLSSNRPPLPESTRTKLCTFPLATLWHRRAHSHSLRPPSSHSIHQLDGSMSSAFLDGGVPGHARLHCNGQCDDRRGY